MGTCGAFGFRLNGQDKVTYNHCDSYPTGLGLSLLEDLKGSSIEHLTRVAQEIILVPEGATPTPEQVETCKGWANLSVGSRSENDWYCLLRNAQGTLKPYLTEGLRYMLDSQDILLSSLICDWAYIVNLDTRMFEIYKGSQKTLGLGRYNQKLFPASEYTGVALLVEIPLETVFELDNAKEVTQLIAKTVNVVQMQTTLPLNADCPIAKKLAAAIAKLTSLQVPYPPANTSERYQIVRAGQLVQNGFSVFTFVCDKQDAAQPHPVRETLVINTRQELSTAVWVALATAQAGDTLEIRWDLGDEGTAKRLVDAKISSKETRRA